MNPDYETHHVYGRPIIFKKTWFDPRNRNIENRKKNRVGSPFSYPQKGYRPLYSPPLKNISPIFLIPSHLLQEVFPPFSRALEVGWSTFRLQSTFHEQETRSRLTYSSRSESSSNLSGRIYNNRLPHSEIDFTISFSALLCSPLSLFRFFYWPILKTSRFQEWI